MEKIRPGKYLFFLVLGILFWFLFGNILYPAFSTLKISLISEGSFTLLNYIDIFRSDNTLRIVYNSVILGALTVIVCGITGTLLAFFVNYFEFPLKKILDKLLLLPFMLPGLIIVFAFINLYGESGLVTKALEHLLSLEKVPYSFSGLNGILFVHCYTQYVFFYISVSIAIKSMDYSVIESARNLGAGKFRIFRSVILPYITPALIASSVLTFMTGTGSFTAPSLIGGNFRVLTTQILLAKANNYMNVAAANAVLLTIICLFFFGIFSFYEKKAGFKQQVRIVPVKPVRIENTFLRIFFMLAASTTVLFILLPVITILLLSFVKSGSLMMDVFPKAYTFENFLNIFTKPRTFDPFSNSLVMAFMASLAGVIIAVVSSFVIIRTKLKLRVFLSFVVMLPWTMPASVIAINLINAYNKPNMFAFGSILVGSFILLPLGYLLRTLPVVIKTTNLSFQNLNDDFIDASKSLGASKRTTFFKVVFPLISPGLMAGFLLIFIRSLGEYTISAFLYTPSNKPVSIAMINAVFEYNIGLAMAYGALLIILSVWVCFMTDPFSG